MHIFLLLLSSYTNVARFIYFLAPSFSHVAMYPRDYFIEGHTHLPPSFHICLIVLCVAVPLYFMKIISVQSLGCVRLFVTPWTAARQASLSITNSRSLLKLMSIESVMPSNHLILCCPLLLLPSLFPSIRVFCNESLLHIRCPKYWSFSFSISPSNEYSGLISFRMD